MFTSEEVTLACRDCGARYTVSSSEQNWLKEHFGVAMRVPLRCKPCRDRRKRERRDASRDGER
jgi:hypothetical protein